MKKFLIDDLSDVAYAMYRNIVDGNCEDILFIGLYKDSSVVIKELLMYDETILYDIDLESEDSGYEKEYTIFLDKDFNILCYKSYDIYEKNYLYDETDCLFIADDCNSLLLGKIDCNKDNMYEVSYDLDDECDGNCACCQCTENNNHEEITRVATDENGKLRGFEKSWETHEDGLTYKSTYSFYSSNENMLKDMLNNFNIKY